MQRDTSPDRIAGPVLGADISWPQCPKGLGIKIRQGEGKPLPVAEAKFVILGLTNGPSFYPNPCLASQYAWARQRHLRIGAYAVAMFPTPEVLKTYAEAGPFDPDTQLGRLGNVGYAEAEFNIATMKQVGIKVPLVWIDVEPYPLFPWSKEAAANAAVVKGQMRSYRAAGYRIGFYSTQSLWRAVLGDLQFGLPEWRATGQSTGPPALARCAASYSFQGGAAALVQWVQDERDQNLTCAGPVVDLSRLFSRS